jgi:hypothetical protein
MKDIDEREAKPMAPSAKSALRKANANIDDPRSPK